MICVMRADLVELIDRRLEWGRDLVHTCHAECVNVHCLLLRAKNEIERLRSELAANRVNT